jgi:hypothetical protein
MTKNRNDKRHNGRKGRPRRKQSQGWREAKQRAHKLTQPKSLYRPRGAMSWDPMSKTQAHKQGQLDLADFGLVPDRETALRQVLLDQRRAHEQGGTK